MVLARQMWLESKRFFRNEKDTEKNLQEKKKRCPKI